MKLKWIPIVAVLVIGLTLAGCGAGVEASTSAGGIASTQLSDAETLALGTLKLEDTAQAVDAEQAAELLPLWKAALEPEHQPDNLHSGDGRALRPDPRGDDPRADQGD